MNYRYHELPKDFRILDFFDSAPAQWQTCCMAFTFEPVSLHSKKQQPMSFETARARMVTNLCGELARPQHPPHKKAVAVRHRVYPLLCGTAGNSGEDHMRPRPNF